ncbi:carbon-nitrogen hydrolase family protein [Deinococcus peraridilitoris]|uniref:Putative amidohydrolase n=1 Tax=Deinococcus peraridilitoris (strain DSM 19664 / LMG 22246 / CIP 109416 / KR-200) TaxID=937777 RepID=L0A154_DEIPD|nr:carbon-nitrogen hydrolase family protein [Deinococcus peraridilitoris]AFZ66740.1 putative amidohydrolase [Deinococcus peraridilitoris DSM 19664]
MKLALAQYPVSYLQSWEAAAEKISNWTAQAAEAGAQVLVFPEYASMELTSLLSVQEQQDVKKQLPALQPYRERFVELHRDLARRHGVYLLAGSFPVHEDGRYVNRAYFLAPGGRVEFQDKLVMTRFETDTWGVAPGKGLKVFDTACGRLGVNICYDSEFPHLARALAQSGADLLLVPSCTEAITGYHRVEIGSRARALENQMYTAQSPLIGTAPWNEVIDVNTGAAGVYGPIDHGFSPGGDGVVVKGPLNVATWVYADLDLARLREVRENGHTINARDWPHGVRQAAPGAQVVTF